MNVRRHSIKLAAMLFAGAGLLTVPAQATLTVLSYPPFISTDGVKTNLVLTIDDSGSMDAAYVPDSISGTYTQKRYHAATFNALYYDPSITYTPPPKFNGSTCSIASNLPNCWPNATFTAAWHNGFAPTTNGTIDLSNAYQPTRDYKVDGSSHSRGANLMEYAPGASYPNTVCNVSFDHNGPNDRIVINSGCAGVFTGLTAGTQLTVTGSARAGVYTVTSVDAGNNRIFVGDPWTSDLNTQNVAISWGKIKPAYYFMHYTKAGVSTPAACTPSDTNDEDCYVGAIVGASPAPGGAPAGTIGDKTAGTSALQKQNFANWYSYYRIRTLALSSGVMRAFATIDSDIRVGWLSFNSCTTLPTDGTLTSACRGWNDAGSITYDNRLRRLSAPAGATGVSLANHKEELYRYLERIGNNGGAGTDLLNTSHKAGQFFSSTVTTSNSPYAEDPQIAAGTFYSCRRNVHVILTDGLWNDSLSTTLYDNANTTTVTTPTGPGGVANYTWTPADPYTDSNTRDLADIAFYYWSHDLSTLPDTLSPYFRTTLGTNDEKWLNPRNNPATWQHMQTYAMGLGLSSSLTAAPVWGGSTYAGGYNDIVNNVTQWPSTSTAANRVYDLWHASICGRGQFFSAENPNSIVAGLGSIVSDVTGATAAAAALAANSTSLSTGAVVYQAQFDSRDWSGHLYNFTVTGSGTVNDVNSDGKLDGADANWDAATLIPASASRNIYTRTSTGPVSFAWANLESAQQDLLKTDVADTLGPDRLAWLRGSSAMEERNGGTFRNRPVTVLGDIINSNPHFVGRSNFLYTKLPASAPEKTSYEAFVNSKTSRIPMVYVGANDGMLHGFRADIGQGDSGVEKMAYVPRGVYGKLRSLTDPLYSHQYLVDGGPNHGDAYIGGSWKSVLVGGLGLGGKSIYALDVSSPNAFDTTHVLWEKTSADTDFGDLGLTYSQARIVRLNNGQWVAMFGNGYNSASDKAFLFIVNLADGSLIRKIPTNSDTANGLSTPALYDLDDDAMPDVAYAGDLRGNVWKFDLSDTDPSNWSASHLFQAKIGANEQPITVVPSVAAHPLGGVMVYFGTGEYITTGATNDLTVQSFYGLWDDGTSITGRSALEEQEIEVETTAFGRTVRQTSNNTVDYAGTKRGWYIDLVPPSGVAAGERVVSRSLLIAGRVLFVTLIPSTTDKCVPGGRSFLMEVERLTGGRPTVTYFDLNDDGSYDSGDLLPGNIPVTGIELGAIATTPVVLSGGEGGSSENFDSLGGGSVGGGEAIGGGGGDLHKLFSKTDTLITHEKNRDDNAPPPGTGARVYWRQVY